MHQFLLLSVLPFVSGAARANIYCEFDLDIRRPLIYWVTAVMNDRFCAVAMRGSSLANDRETNFWDDRTLYESLMCVYIVVVAYGRVCMTLIVANGNRCGL